VLHPRHKLEYFKAAGWDQDWIDTAQDIVEAEFDRSYAQLELSDAENDRNPLPQVSFWCYFDLFVLIFILGDF
jgi:hypothetical protein